MEIHIPDRTASTIGGTKGSQGASLVTMPTRTCLASQFSKPELDNVVSKSVSRKQNLDDDLELSLLEDGQNDVPISSFQIPLLSKNAAGFPSQPRFEALTSTNTASFEERLWDVTSKYVHATKENICPNSGNDRTDDSNAHRLITGNVVGRSDPKQSTTLVPIPVTSKVCITEPYPQSDKQAVKPGNMPFVSYSESPEGGSKHIFVTQASGGVERPSRNESLDTSLQDQNSQQIAEILSHVKEQESRIIALEKEVKERDSRIDELVETNSKLVARVMVLETAVALIQEKLET
jgi:hypothetical protein